MTKLSIIPGSIAAPLNDSRANVYRRVMLCMQFHFRALLATSWPLLLPKLGLCFPCACARALAWRGPACCVIARIICIHGRKQQPTATSRRRLLLEHKHSARGCQTRLYTYMHGASLSEFSCLSCIARLNTGSVSPIWYTTNLVHMLCLTANLRPCPDFHNPIASREALCKYEVGDCLPPLS
jgi:hypothetical protein